MNMRHFLFWLGYLLLGIFSLSAQTFVGTNAPGQGSNYTFSVSAGATNLSLVISNNSTAYSYLFLKAGGVPTDTSVGFAVGEAQRGPTDKPTRITSLADFQATYGDRITGVESYDGLDGFFHDGGTTAYFMRAAPADAMSPPAVPCN